MTIYLHFRIYYLFIYLNLHFIVVNFISQITPFCHIKICINLILEPVHIFRKFSRSVKLAQNYSNGRFLSPIE